MSFGSETGSTKSFKMHEKNQGFTALILKAPTKNQQTDFQTKLPAVWKDGNPKMQWVFDLYKIQETVCDCDEWCEGGAKNADYGTADDNGRRKFFVASSGNLINAIAAALKAAKAPGGDPEVGGVLTVKRTGVDHSKNKGTGKPPVTYSAQYTRATSESVNKAHSIESPVVEESIQDDSEQARQDNGGSPLTMEDILRMSTEDDDK